MGKVPGQMEGAARDQGSAEGNHDNPSDKLLDSHAIFALHVFANQKENLNINIQESLEASHSTHLLIWYYLVHYLIFKIIQVIFYKKL